MKSRFDASVSPRLDSVTEPMSDFAGTWVVLPTYNEIENLPQIAPAILKQLPGATLLVVDDSSPDGTGRLADELAAADPRVQVLHRRAKQGLGRAYAAGFEAALERGAQRLVQMDADWSHDPAYLPGLVGRLAEADLVIGSRYVAGGGVRNWGFMRRFVSRGGSLFARTVLGLSPHDLTGGFKAWRRETLAQVPWQKLHSGGYVFQIETTYVASRQGARVTELPIVFVDRRLGASKMSRRIIFEALHGGADAALGRAARSRPATQGTAATGMTRLVASPKVKSPPRGVRVVVDVRPMQEPERTPLTAEYLERLLAAFAAEPLADKSFVLVSRAMRDDPADELEDAGLPIVARRRLPPTSRVFRSAGLTLDSFLLRGAEIGTAEQTGTIFHTAGGAVPLASRMPVVATLLDLAPWELPGTYAASPAARFGHRLRRRVLHDAARVIVCSRATAESARRLLHLPAERLAIVPLAVDEAFRSAGRNVELVGQTRERLGLPARYMAFAGRYDARKDLRTLFSALALLRGRDGSQATSGRRSRGNGRNGPPPALVFALQQDAPDERRLVEDALERSGVAALVTLVAPRDAAERAAVVAGSEAFVYPCLSEATALPALEALSLGVPVICSRAGALPETVGSAGIVVEPRDANRLAAAIEALWFGGSLADQLRRQAHRRAESDTRSWSDVALETREVYAAAAEAHN